VTAAEMRRIGGVGDVKLERYGGEFIAEIKAYGK
jgi:superfamily II DNA helicase RecQ